MGNIKNKRIVLTPLKTYLSKRINLLKCVSIHQKIHLEILINKTNKLAKAIHYVKIKIRILIIFDYCKDLRLSWIQKYFKNNIK